MTTGVTFLKVSTQRFGSAAHDRLEDLTLLSGKHVPIPLPEWRLAVAEYIGNFQTAIQNRPSSFCLESFF